MQQRDGYTKDVADGKDLDNKNLLRLARRRDLRPTDDIENYFVYDGYWQDTNGSGDMVKFYNPKLRHSRLSRARAARRVPLTLGTRGRPAISALENWRPAATYVALKREWPRRGGLRSLYPEFSVRQLSPKQQALGVRADLGSASRGSARIISTVHRQVHLGSSATI
jgi:hypothetical protein